MTAGLRAGWLTAAAFGCCLVASPVAAAHNWWAAPGGTGDCLTQQTACDINTAMAIASPDGTSVVLALPGTYNENVDTTGPGLPSGSFLVGYGDGPHVINQQGAGPALQIGKSVDVRGFTIQGTKPVTVTGASRLTSSSISGLGAHPGDALVEISPGASDVILDRLTIQDDTPADQVGIGSATTGATLIEGARVSGFMTGLAIAPGATATVQGSSFTGDQEGVTVGTGATATLSSDLIAAGGIGLEATGANIQATNLTALDNTSGDIALSGSSLTLDSSLVGQPIAAAAGSGCAISFSAGPPSAPPCDGFALPSAGAGLGADYKLTAGSPLVDMGDPADPGANTLDLDGSPRAIAGTCGGSVRRDIGADEFVPDCSGYVPPGTTPPTPMPIPTDTDPPATRISRIRVNGRNATVRFGSDETQSSFLCSLDAGRFKACTSPKRYRDLDRSRHLFEVKATDAAGNADATAARRRFTIG